MRTVPSSPGLCAGFELLCLEKEELIRVGVFS